MSLRRPRERRGVGWGLVAGVPAALAAMLVPLSLREDLMGEIVRREFVNCYVSVPTFLGFLGITAVLLLVCARRGPSLVTLAGVNPYRVTGYTLMLMVMGAVFMQSFLLSHAWFDWTPLQRWVVASVNLAMVAMTGGITLFSFPPWRHVKMPLTRKLLVLTTFLLWGYVVASGFRMLPFFVAVQ